jgi:hypothetical protein
VPWIVGVAVVSLVLPPFVIYRLDWTSLTGTDSIWPSIGLMLATVALAAAATMRRLGPRRAAVAAIATACGIGLGIAYPAAASTDISSNLDATATVNRIDSGVFHVGYDWVRWMQREHLQEEHMGTWYDASSARTFNGIASLYYFGWILQGSDMPKITPTFRQLWRARAIDKIVLLCSTPSCENAPAALRRAGYRLRLRARHVFRSGPITLWVRVLAEQG